MDEILSVIIFGGYSAFVLNLNIGGHIDLKLPIVEFIILAVLYIGAAYHCVIGLNNLDIVNLIIGNIALWSMKLIKLR